MAFNEFLGGSRSDFCGPLQALQVLSALARVTVMKFVLDNFPSKDGCLISCLRTPAHVPSRATIWFGSHVRHRPLDVRPLGFQGATVRPLNLPLWFR